MPVASEMAIGGWVSSRQSRHGCAFGFSCDSWFRAIGNQMKGLTGENDDA
jgi:hypothetical protein